MGAVPPANHVRNPQHRDIPATRRISPMLRCSIIIRHACPISPSIEAGHSARPTWRVPMKKMFLAALTALGLAATAVAPVQQSDRRVSGYAPAYPGR